MSNLPILIIVIPLCAAFVISIVDLTRVKKFSPCLSLASISISLGLIGCLGPRIFAGEQISYALGGWQIPLGITLLVDGLSYFFSLIATLLMILSIIFSINKEGMHHFFLLLLYVGMIGVIYTQDLFNMYVFYEILAISSYILVTSDIRGSLKASLKYLFLGSIASAFFLLGIGILYGQTGTLNLDLIAFRIPEILQDNPLTIGLVASLFLFAFGIKCGAFPLHTWVPDAHSLAPTAVSVLLSGVILKIGIYVLIRVFWTFPYLGIEKIIMWLGIFSLMFGALMALAQDDIKRLLAYSSISQIGCILIGIGIGSESGLKGSLFHILNHAVMKGCLFFCAGLIIFSTQKRKISELKGFGKHNPLLSFLFILAALSIIGIPPFNGFVSKWIICQGAVESGNIFPGIMIILASIIAVAYYGRIIQLFLSPGEPFQESPDIGYLQYIAPCVLSISCVLLGIFPFLGINLVEHAVKMFY